MAKRGSKREHTFKSPEAFAKKLKDGMPRGTRRGKHRLTRHSPTAEDRRNALKKTGGRCHICGGHFTRKRRPVMDHVLAHSSGGLSQSDNYLPAHAGCNASRWHFSPEEWRMILKLGVFARDKVEKQKTSQLGHDIAIAFIQKEEARIRRAERVRAKAAAANR